MTEYTELILKRENLKVDGVRLMMHFMKATDKKEASEILVKIRDLAKMVEEINCKLAGIELQQKLRGKGKS